MTEKVLISLRILVLGLPLFFAFDLKAQFTTIPDAAFEQALIDLGHDTMLDGQVLTANISNIKTLYASNKGISDLTGIEDFNELEILYCRSNLLTSLDLSSNPVLWYLSCSQNQLIELNISSNSELKVLYGYMNNLASLNVTGNPLLETLDCSNNLLINTVDLSENQNLTSLRFNTNEITYLNVSANPLLKSLDLGKNQLTSLYVGNNKAVEYLMLYNNNLTSLDVTDNPLLTTLYVNRNNLTGLNVRENILLTSLHVHFNYFLTNLDVSQNTALTFLYCGITQLTNLDLSKNTELIYLDCQGSELPELDVTNNSKLTYLYCHSNQLTSLDISGNPLLNRLISSNNQISNFEIGDHPNLETVQLSNNKLNSFPDFSTHGNETNLKFYTENNYFNFSSIEQNLVGIDTYEFNYFGYNLQLNADAILDISCGTTTLVNDRAGGDHTNYQWKGWDGNDWVTIIGATSQDLLNFLQYPYSQFQCYMTNDWVNAGNLVLRSSVFKRLDMPTPVITQTGPHNVCQPDSQLLSVANTYESYQWYVDGLPIPGANTYSYSASQSGDFTVVACGQLSNVVNVTYFNNPTIVFGSIGNTSCLEAADAEFSFHAEGGLGSYTYEVRTSSNELHSSGSIIESAITTITGLSMGSYRIIVQDVAAPCSPVQRYTYIQNGGPRITLCASSVACTAIDDGNSLSELAVTVNRFHPQPDNNYTYEVRNNSNELVASGSGIFGQEISPKPQVAFGAPSYTFNVLDGVGNPCLTTTSSFTIQPAEISVALNTANGTYKKCEPSQVIEVIFTPSISTTSCTTNTGSGVFDVVVQKDGEAYTELVDQTGPISLLGPPPGNYIATITGDYMGIGSCTIVKAFTVLDISSETQVDIAIAQPLCNDPGNDGSATATVTGGEAPYQYEWFLGETLLSRLSKVTGLSTGTYRLEVTGGGCTIPYATEFDVISPTPVGDAITITPPVDDCDMSATLTNAGGVGPYTFYWISEIEIGSAFNFFNATTQQWESSLNSTIRENVEFIDRNVTANAGSATSFTSTNEVKPGIIKVRVEDANGCTIESTTTLIEQPEFLREYALCFRWKTPAVEVDDQPQTPTVITSINITASGLSQSLKSKAESCINDQTASFEAAFDQFCLSLDYLNDEVTLTYDMATYHHTLYYYDRAGNLVHTVPPKGVMPLTGASLSRANTPAHTLVTNYNYNNLGQLLRQNSPDGGETHFIYNNVGQLRFSQNARQALPANNLISYTKYDALSRIAEVGQATLGTDYTAPDNTVFTTNSFAELANDDLLALDKETYETLPIEARYPTVAHGLNEQTLTLYGTPVGGVEYNGEAQSYLRNRVSATTAINASGEEVNTYYSYDPHGNVKWLQQDIPGLGIKQLGYDYDLLSGNVLKVKYDEGASDQFFHKYTYDEDNRIKAVFTSQDNIIWERDAAYEYFDHGPLERTIIGKNKVQTLDYAYTLHGWLKAVNNPALGPLETETGTADAFAMTLGYYQGDFQNDGSLLDSQQPGAKPLPALSGRDLYNGNISSWQIGTQASDNSWMLSGYQYSYDELNRIESSNFNIFKKVDDNDVRYSRAGFGANFSLDPNGNLETLNRFDIDADRIDSLQYHLVNNTNQLEFVDDRSLIDPTKHNNDLEDQALANYTYDPIGNLVHDNQEDMDIDWTVYGKVKNTLKSDATGTEFIYDAAGNRVAKKTTDEHGTISTNYYIRDASGNIMAVYKKLEVTGEDPELKLVEVPIYGSDRIGSYNPFGSFGNTLTNPVPVAGNQSANSYEGVSYNVEGGVTITLTSGFIFDSSVDGDVFFIGTPGVAEGSLDKKLYELKDHLGNVRAVVTDRKTGDVSSGTPADIIPTIASAAAYYPYGMDMPTVLWGEDLYKATYEDENAVDEFNQFINYGDADRVNNPLFNHTVCDGCTVEPFRAQLLTAETGGIIGLAKSLKVQAGDKVAMEVYGKYYAPEVGASPSAVAAAIGTSFINAFNIPAGPEGAALTDFFTDLFAAGSVFGTNGNTDEVYGYLNYQLYDKNFLPVDMGFIALTTDALEDGSDIPHEYLTLEVPINQDGYIYMYLSNESDKVCEVYFDDFKITHEKLVPDLAYSTGTIAYRYGFNGKEKDQSNEFGMNHYDYGFRIYNPAIAKFLSVDPLSKKYPWYTPYQFAGNKPIWATDLDGLEEYIYQYTLKDDRVTLIKVVGNVKYKPIAGGYGAAHIEKIDKRTGEKFNPNELGKIQYQYFDDEGNRLKIRRNLDGELVKGTNELLKGHSSNFFESTYIGNINPQPVDGKYDYRREPQDLVDAAALQHDKDYDEVGGSGFKGAFVDQETLSADIKLIQAADRTILAFENKEIDPYTNKAVSKKTLKRAKSIKVAFEIIVTNKIKKLATREK